MSSLSLFTRSLRQPLKGVITLSSTLPQGAQASNGVIAKGSVYDRTAPSRRTQARHKPGFVRCFTHSAFMQKKQMPPRPKLNPADVDGSYLKGTGPGGQKINKTNSAVQLIHKPTGIVIKCQETRSRSQNHKIAMERLAEKVEFLEKGDQSRAAIVQATKAKRKASMRRKKRKKYRNLEEKKKWAEAGVRKEEVEVEEEEEEEEEGEREHVVDEVERGEKKEVANDLKAEVVHEGDEKYGKVQGETQPAESAGTDTTGEKEAQDSKDKTASTTI